MINVRSLLPKTATDINFYVHQIINWDNCKKDVNFVLTLDLWEPNIQSKVVI